MGSNTKRKFKNDQSMGGELPKTRQADIYSCHERGIVGWAHWRAMKKKSTQRLRRHVHDKKVIQEEIDEMSNPGIIEEE